MRWPQNVVCHAHGFAWACGRAKKHGHSEQWPWHPLWECIVGVKWIIIAGALLAASGVALGAFGAHGLDKQLQALGRDANLAQRIAWFETGVRYHMYHALGLLALAAIAGRLPSGGMQAAAVLFIVGIALFSGSLYAMTFAGDAWRKLGMVTPLGGLAFIVGWITLAVAAWRSS